MRKSLWNFFKAGLLVSPLVTAIACQSLRCRDGECLVSDGPLDCPAGVACPDNARVCRNPTVHALAADLDHLEKHIDWYGSVTAKVPDVWGQARLTQHREEIEIQMKDELNKFDPGLQGSFARSDQSYLAAALSLGIASQPKAPVIGNLTTGSKTVTAPEPKLVVSEQTTKTNSEDKTTGTKTEATKKEVPANEPAAPKAPDPVKIPDTADPSTLVSKAGDVIKRSEKVEFTKFDFAGKEKGIGIEPAERLLQKKRYLDLLNQLRRENEGSDTADAPGYQLNLVRLPVNVLPGHRTDRGFGAEVTFTLDPVLGADLLPTTFRRMVCNDVAMQMAWPLTAALDDKDIRKLLNPRFRSFVRVLTRLNDFETMDPSGRRSCLFVHSLTVEESKALDEFGSEDLKIRLCELRTCACDARVTAPANGIRQASAQAPATPRGPAPQADSKASKNATKPSTNVQQFLNTIVATGKPTTPRRSSGPITSYTTPSLSFANGLDTKQAFPTSQLFEVYGETAVFEIAYGAYDALAGSIDFQGYAHLPDIQSFLKEELRASYEFLVKN